MKRILKSVIMPATFVFFFVWVLSACSAEKGGIKQPADYKKALTAINPDFMITPDEAYEWHLHKDKGGPTYSGNASWQSYMSLIEKKLKKYGVVDITKNKWTYKRWYTSDWPDDSNWTLVSDGQPVKVAHYAAYSGSTGPQGITANMVLYTPKTPMASLKGKIVVFRTAPHPKPPLDEKYKKWFTLNDYEYRHQDKDFPPLFTQIPPSQSVSYDVWWQLRQTVMVYKVLRKSQAAGGVVVFNMGYDRLSGLFTFPVLPQYNAPNLYVDRVSGAKLIKDAKKSIVALVATEHLGQIEFREVDDKYEPTGKLEISFLWSRNNQMLIDKAIKAVQDNNWPRVMVQSVERPGKHGGPQGIWYGLGKIALAWDLPGYGTMGAQGAYWATTARIDTFNKEHFVTEVAAMSQLTGELMLADFK